MKSTQSIRALQSSLKLGLAALVLGASSALYAADPMVGMWQSIDDTTNKPKALIQISESGGELSGSIVKRINPPSDICHECEGPYAHKSLKGMKVFTDLKSDGSGAYSGGSITDPKTGKTYKLKANLEGADTLKMRGYMGVSLLGRTQTWKRVK